MSDELATIFLIAEIKEKSLYDIWQENIKSSARVVAWSHSGVTRREEGEE